MAPRIVTEELLPRFEMLADMIVQLSTRPAGNLNQNPPASSGNSNQNPLIFSDEQPNIEQLVVSAREVLYQAKSSIDESEGGSDSSSVVTTILHRLDILEEDVRVNDSTAGQPTRLDPTSEQRRSIEDWIPVVSPGSTTSQFDSRSATTRTQMTPTQTTPSISTFEEEPIFTQEDSDDDDEFEYELLQGYLDKGFTSYTDGNWEAAEPFLRRAIDASKILPMDKTRLKGFDIAEAQFKIAVCAFHQRKLDDADREFFQLRTSRSAPDEPRKNSLRRILSLYLFAGICFQRKKLEEAHKSCHKALSTKRKMLGPTNWLEANCFSLLSSVSAAQGDIVTGEVYTHKAEVTGSPDSSLDKDPEIKAARIDSLITSRIGPGPPGNTIKW